MYPKLTNAMKISKSIFLYMCFSHSSSILAVVHAILAYRGMTHHNPHNSTLTNMVLHNLFMLVLDPMSFVGRSINFGHVANAFYCVKLGGIHTMTGETGVFTVLINVVTYFILNHSMYLLVLLFYLLSLNSNIVKQHHNATFTHLGNAYTCTRASVNDEGFYEMPDSTYTKPITVSYSYNFERNPHSWRFLWFDARTLPTYYTTKLREIVYSMPFTNAVENDSIDFDLPIGHRVPFREPNSFGANMLVYRNCGPLNPMTAFKVWRRFSGNDITRPVLIAWDNISDSNDPDGDIFSFPFYEDKDRNYLYSWSRGSITIPGVFNNVECFIPVAQKIDYKVKNIDTLVVSLDMHYHTFLVNVTVSNPLGDYITKKCLCNSDCFDVTGSILNPPVPVHGVAPTHGLWQEDYNAVMSHLVSQDAEAASKSAPVFVMSKPSWNGRTDLLPKYCASLLVERSLAKTKIIDPNLYPNRDNFVEVKKSAKNLDKNIPTNMTDFSSTSYIPKNEPTCYVGGKTPEKQPLEIRISRYAKRWQYLNKIDPKAAEDLISGVASKYQRQSNEIKYLITIETSHSKEIGGSYSRRNYGDALDFPVRENNLRCNVCNNYAPLKFKWYKSICPSCTHEIRKTNFGDIGEESIRNEISSLSFYVHDGVKNLKYPTVICPILPQYKPKPQRAGLRTGKDFTWSKPGYKLPRKTPKYGNSSGSHFIGVVAARRATTLNLKSPNIEHETIKCRLFAQPASQPAPGIFSKLFDFALKYDLIGDRKTSMRPMPFCPYDFSENGWLAQTLMNLNLATKYNLEKKLGKCKLVLDYLNAEAWKIDDWPELGKTRYWLEGFEPRKKANYLKAIINFDEENLNKMKNELKYPRVDFSFFLKRELQPHTSDYYGVRSSLNPRVICNPDAWTQVVAGPYLKSLTENLHVLWGVDNPITYFGGLSPGQGNEWLKSVLIDWKTMRPEYNRVVENDFSKFDCTYSDPCFKFIRQIYSYWGMPVDLPIIDHVLEGWQRPCGQFRSGLLVSGPVMNASGRSDTALMNALVNGVVQVASYAMAEQGVNDPSLLDEKRTRAMLQKIKIGVLGDDSLTFYHNFADMARTVGDAVALFGFEARDMKVHTNPCVATFLACRPYPTVDKNGTKSVHWGPTMRKLNKMGIAVDLQENPYSWLYTNMIASLVTSYHVPFISDITLKTLDLLKDFTFLRNNNIQTVDSIKYSKHMIHNLNYHNILKETTNYIPDLQFDYLHLEEWLNVVYGLSTNHYRNFQNMLQQVTSPTAVYRDWAVEHMIKLDTGA